VVGTLCRETGRVVDQTGGRAASAWTRRQRWERLKAGGRLVGLVEVPRVDVEGGEWWCLRVDWLAPPAHRRTEPPMAGLGPVLQSPTYAEPRRGLLKVTVYSIWRRVFGLVYQD
jgi:hypothetical protein